MQDADAKARAPMFDPADFPEELTLAYARKRLDALRKAGVIGAHVHTRQLADIAAR